MALPSRSSRFYHPNNIGVSFLSYFQSCWNGDLSQGRGLSCQCACFVYRRPLRRQDLMSFSQYLFLLQDDAERSTNEMQFQTVGISKTRHQYLRYFLLVSSLFQQFPSSTTCSERRGSVSVFEKRVLLHLCYSEAKRTREKLTFSVGNFPRPALDSNECDVAWCAGCWRSGAATPCSRFASLPVQAS